MNLFKKKRNKIPLVIYEKMHEYWVELNAIFILYILYSTNEFSHERAFEWFVQLIDSYLL